jgi:hypothetical protein
MVKQIAGSKALLLGSGFGTPLLPTSRSNAQWPQCPASAIYRVEVANR